MNSAVKVNPPLLFWLIAVLAMVWNGMGLMEYLNQMQMTAEDLAKLPAFEQQMRSSTPGWVNMAFGAAVIFGVLGSLTLLLRKSWASHLFLISMIAVLAQMSYLFFVSGYFQVKGWGLDVALMPVSIVIVALFLWSYGVKAYAKGWIY